MEKSPKLSIVMPFFNQKELVAEMIDSILANDYQDWELLAVDDGSTAETIEYLSHYSNVDSRIHFIPRNREPKGAPTCRNIGMEMARGEYLIFFDSDDYITPYCLTSRVVQLDTHEMLDFMIFPSGEYNERGFYKENAKYSFGYPLYRNDLKALIRRTLPFVVVNNIYRTASIRAKRLLWDTHLQSYQDSDFNIQALLKGLQYDYSLSEPDYGYRIAGNTNSISKNITSEKHRKSHLYFLDKQYQEVQSVYGKKYNKALYQCALYIYHESMPSGIDAAFASSIAEIVGKHDNWRGRLLKLKVKASLLLSKVIPQKLARQLPMPIFLLRRRWLIKAIPRRISKCQRQIDLSQIMNSI